MNCTFCCDNVTTDAPDSGVAPLTQAFGAVGAATLVGLLPTVAMAVGSLAPLCPCYKSNEYVQAIFQNLSAGIIIAAVGGELFPLLAHEGGATWQADLGLFVGFFVGILMMFGIKILSDKLLAEKSEKPVENNENLSELEDGEDGGDGGDDQSPLVEKAKQMQTDISELQEELGSPRPNRFKVDALIHRCQAVIDASRRDLAGESSHLGENDVVEAKELTSNLLKAVNELQDEISNSDGTKDQIKSKVEKAEKEANILHQKIDQGYFTFRRWRLVHEVDEEDIVEKLPVPLIAAVLIDAFVDGFLVGISYIADSQAGFIISGAACIEDGFLGLTFSATLKNSTKSRWKHILLALSGPATLLVAAVVGGLVGELIQQFPAVMVGFIAWSMVCLLFLVTQELLFEAIENQNGSQIWWVNVWVFVGIFIVLLAEKLFELVPGAEH